MKNLFKSCWPSRDHKRLAKENAAQQIAINQKATEAFVKKTYPDENFISSTAQLQKANKHTKELVIPKGVCVAVSRIPKNKEQREILQKELRQAGILARSGNSVYLIPERSGYKIRPQDAVVNGALFEFRTVEGNPDTFQWEFRYAKKKGADTNVYINDLSGISKNEARHRIWLVLRRHPEYTGQIVISFENGSKTYFWDTSNLYKKSLPRGRVREGEAELNHNRSLFIIYDDLRRKSSVFCGESLFADGILAIRIKSLFAVTLGDSFLTFLQTKPKTFDKSPKKNSQKRKQNEYFRPIYGMKTNKENPPRNEWGPFPFGDQRILDIRYDPVFKGVFTRDTAKSRGALSGLISALIGRTVTVETIIANEPPVDDLRQRYLRFDVACKTGKGELVNIEMAFNPKASEPVRLEYHVARLFLWQDIHGKTKNYSDLKETYQIAILAKEKFFPDENFAHNFLYHDPNTNISLGGRTQIITVELVKTEPVADKPVEKMTNAELWAVFFQYLTDEEKRGKITEIINREEGIAMAVETLVNITQDEIEYERMTNLIKSQLDYQSGMVDAERKGRAEGHTEKALEIARNMKEMGFSPEQIQAATGLTAEEINKSLNH
ncbi:MAG: Rpn family recombination-promoting nuclease/putative transposase [Treponema sp.]|jgi:predicted transposase/invertase (TIGR01784 family)|nr:Rpn family recombination-promoting nuclease/putative transposase [Treponema sp.]